METVVVILKQNPESFNNPGPWFKAVAVNYTAALCWIAEETKKDQYMDGKTPEEWIAMGYFKIEQHSMYTTVKVGG